MDETAFRELISGNRRGIVASLLRFGLRILSPLYGLGVGVRNRCFDFRLKPIHKAPAPVVSVGNITTGGTGKTPFVAYLAHWFREKNVRVVLLSRGYRAQPGEANDEKLVLDQLCPGVPHLQNPNRVESARHACREHHAEVLILDDGFQHRRLARDLDIVLIDALNPWGYGHLLPRGLLREPPSSLRRANLVVLTRADQCSQQRKQEIIDRIQSLRSDSAHVEVAYLPQRLIDSRGETAPLDSLVGKRVTAFCGIGNPHSFQQMLTEAGFLLEPESFRAFPDHHHYTPEELTSLGLSASHHQSDAILTTQKDLVKIHAANLAGCPLWSVQIGTTIRHGNDLLERQLEAVLSSVAQ